MSNNYHADVIVAGAGPAGATAALRLARAGLRVLMVERARCRDRNRAAAASRPGSCRGSHGCRMRCAAFPPAR
jgi:flavin-dependent dehydrogenase